MHIQGASNSCGLISGVCLNLDGEIRYKPENMYIGGIIPGPCEPCLTRINHFIRPKIIHFCESWEKGVHFSCTMIHPNGRVTCSIIVAAVMDMKVARGTTGLGQNNYDHHCLVCQCWGKAMLGSTDHENWLPCYCAELHKQAEKWQTATTLKDQEEIFSKYGVCYSKFYHPDNWDPTC